jgi:Polysaccharide lyase
MTVVSRRRFLVGLGSMLALPSVGSGVDLVKPPRGTLYFGDDFDRDAEKFIPPWHHLVQQESGRIITTTEQARKGTHSVKLTALFTDNPNGWGSRADLFAPRSGASACREGEERWVGWSILFPSKFLRNLTSAGRLMTAMHGYSAHIPQRVAYYFHGGPSTYHFELTIQPGTSRDDILIWKTRPTFGQWMDFVAHYKFSVNPNIGFVELWYNGVRQTFSNDSQRYYTNTLEPGSPNLGGIVHNNYREVGSMGSSFTIYQDEIKVGNSFKVVAP